MRVLSLMAHPDDAEIFCGGALIRLQELGWDVHIASMTPGDCGSKNQGPSEISDVRRREGAAAAAKIRATYHCLDQRDLSIFYDKPTLQAAVELVRQIRPTVVITHPPQDYMPDHEMTSLVARAACFASSAPNYDTGRRPAAPSGDAIPHLYYSAPANGTNIFGEPGRYSVFVDISNVIGLKADMLACHESQRQWLRAQHGMDHYIEEMRGWAAKQGNQCGVEFAEGFRQHVGHPYPGEDILAQTLGAAGS